MTGVVEAIPARRPSMKRLRPAWWLVVKDGAYAPTYPTVECGGGRALPVFSGEGEAEVFLWLGDGPGNGWRVRKTSAGELISVLYGPCARMASVALDPSPEMVTTGSVGLVGVSLKRFASWIADPSRTGTS